MKKQLIILALFALCVLAFINNKAYTQTPNFKFHLAFKDATGAKDTIWLIWDSLATNGYDTIFNEVPQSLPTNSFRVYIKYSAIDSGKVKALPMNNSLNGLYIRAQNYVYPINLEWDTSLIFNNNLPFQINTATLDNDWFFFNNNDPINHIYHMQFEDSIQLPSFSWFSQDHFPINFNIGYDPFLNIEQSNYALNNNVILYPNPVNNQLHILIEGENTTYQINLMNITGKVIKYQSINSNSTIINVNELPKGVYFLKITSEHNITIKKIIKY